MFKILSKIPRSALGTRLGCLLLASSVQPTWADACPSIDYWLERIRDRGGQHRLLDPLELSRSIEIFQELAEIQRRRWTSGVLAAFTDGSGLVLLNVDTSVCGVIEVPSERWPAVRGTIASEPI